jgi:multidrug efflux pump subunit AcrB
MSPVELSWFVDDTINSELLTLPGVQKVQRLGGVNREVRVSLDPERLLAVGVTADQVNTALREINTNIPSGRGEIGGREQSIRTVGSAGSVEELSRLSIPLSGGRWVQLSDIATIEDTSSEPRNFARVDGEPVVSFSVSRSKGSSDTVVADAVAARLKEIRARMPGVEFTELISLVEYTQESYDAAVTALIEGAILTVVVVFAFLRNWRATLISALAMPLSILPTFAVMDLLGFTLNGISLLALTLVIGILVDDAIVEIENIERHVDMGKRPFIAAIDAADAIGLAIVATTLTIVAVFAPVSFIGGAVGQYFKQFGLTVAIAVLFSLLVARLLTPLMAAYLLRPRGGHGHAGKPSRIANGYRRLLGWTLDHRKTALSLVALIFIGSIGLLTMLPTGFLPTSDSNVSQLKITLPPGTRLAETARISDDLVGQIKARPEVESVLATAENLNEVSLRIKLKPRKERGLDRKSFELSLRPLLAATPDIQATFSSVEGAKDLSIYLTSDDPKALMASVRRLEKEMRALPGLVNVGFGPGPPRLSMVPRWEGELPATRAPHTG